ncbi:GNAT family N-acetyltransferase [Actinomadura craniellae]|uniref:GNAT family N-acetyltransferase n=1 Tax=Actinomadura craniellae TaxID=2231787 RepID=UPI001313F02F|nr:GNAT family N-acetyltransferase [Actinomadura craniellae]
MTIVPFSLRCAKDEDLCVIIGLIDSAAQWLAAKDTDQWARPWPDERGREQRILDGLGTGFTWLAFDGETPVATVSITDQGNPILWNRPGELEERAVYLHRLVINQDYAGRGLGASLLDWAADYGSRAYGADIVRIDVWQDNEALHAYYRRLGFRPARRKMTDIVRKKRVDIRATKEEWPSGAVFERKIAPRRAARNKYHAQFELADENIPSPGTTGGFSGTRSPATAPAV